MRSNPKGWVPYVKDMTTKFKGRTYNGKHWTREGVKPVKELLHKLETMKPCPQLEFNIHLMKAARDLCVIQGPGGIDAGAMGHCSKKANSTPGSRIRKYMKYERGAGENIMYGRWGPLSTLLGFAIDDGIYGRGHRKNILEPGFAYTGSYTDKWRKSWMTVVNYSGSYKKRNYKGPKVAIPEKVGAELK